jgi:hypothetical protein
MKENVVIAITAISVPSGTGPGSEPDLNPGKKSPETRNILISDSPFKSHALFRIARDLPFSEKDGFVFPDPVCGRDNSLI